MPESSSIGAHARRGPAPAGPVNLQEILSISRAMLEKAREEAWDELIQLEARRDCLIKDQFDAGRSLEYDRASADCIDQILQLNDQILEISRNHHQRLARTLAESKQQRQAAEVYRQARTG